MTRSSGRNVHQRVQRLFRSTAHIRFGRNFRAPNTVKQASYRPGNRNSDHWGEEVTVPGVRVAFLLEINRGRRKRFRAFFKNNVWGGGWCECRHFPDSLCLYAGGERISGDEVFGG